MFGRVDLKCVVVDYPHTKGAIPMRTIPFAVGSANAAACFTGPRGAVTNQAQQTGCSRQSVYDHAQKVERPSRPNTAADRPGRN